MTPPLFKGLPDALVGTIVNALPQIVWIADGSGGLHYCNQFWFEYTGLRPARLSDWRRAIHPDDLPVVLDRFERGVRARGCYEVEYRIRRADGAYRWHLARVQCEPHPEKGPLWLGVAVDIDDRKRAEQRLGLQYLTTRTLAESRSFQEALERVLEGLGHAIGARFAEAWLPERGKLRLYGQWRAARARSCAFAESAGALSLEPGESVPGEVFTDTRARWFEDVYACRSLRRSAEAEKAGLRSAVGLPIFGQGRAIGALVFWGVGPVADKRLLTARSTRSGRSWACSTSARRATRACCASRRSSG